MTAEKSSDEVPGISVAMWFGLLGVALPFAPAYLGFASSRWSVTAFVLSGVCLAIGLAGAAMELRSLGVVDGPAWENLGLGLAIGVLAAIFHLASTWFSSAWVLISARVLASVVLAVALMFVAVGLGQLMVEQKTKRDAGELDRATRGKAIGAFAAFVLALITGLIGLATAVLEYLAATR